MEKLGDGRGERDEVEEEGSPFPFPFPSLLWPFSSCSFKPDGIDFSRGWGWVGRVLYGYLFHFKSVGVFWGHQPV